MKSPINLFSLPGEPLAEEQMEQLLKLPHLRLERIVSTGQTSDWYDQEEHEWVALLQGQATLTFETGETLEMGRGDTVVIPAHKKHKVSATSTAPPCVWLCLFYQDQNKMV